MANNIIIVDQESFFVKRSNPWEVSYGNESSQDWVRIDLMSFPNGIPHETETSIMFILNGSRDKAFQVLLGSWMEINGESIFFE